MNSTFGIRSNCKHRSCCGFALVTALSLMAFMLVLVVTLLSLMEVETRSADNNLELQKAREGARLGLNMAVGKLQEYAGDDKRVTARAEILGDNGTTNNFDDEARYWTGVWDTTNAGANPQWLVSWHDENSEPDPDNVPVDNLLMQLVGEGSVGDDDAYHVFAPYTNILDKNGNVSSRIAWWVSDEGVKASAALLPLDKRPNNPGFTDDASMDALHTTLATPHGLETMFANYSRFVDSDAPEIDRVTSMAQLISQEGFPQNPDPNNTGWKFQYQDENGNDITEVVFHTLTPVSYGLLASTEPGVGLMEDLSLSPTLLGGEFANYVNRGFDSAAARSGEARGSLEAMRQTVEMRGLEDVNPLATLPDGAIASLATPILTNFMMAFAVYESASLGNPHVRMHFFSEFWNPYTSTLEMDDGTNDFDLELEITGLPSVRINIVGGGTGPLINLQDLLGSADPGNPVIIRLDYDQGESWHPGMTKNWTGITNATGPSPYNSDQTLTKDWNDIMYTLGGDVGIPTTALNAYTNALSDRFKVSSIGSNGISVAVYLIDANTDTRVKLLTQNDAIEYSNVDVVGDNDTGLPLGTSTATFGYHFILRGPSSGVINAEFGRGSWLAASDNDPRDPSDGTYDPVSNGSAELAAADPHEIEDYLNKTIDIERPLRLFNRSDQASGDHFRLWQESPLFELPRERVLSLASLQHLYFHNERPFKVGNSWGDEGVTDTLEWFDRYFFSGLSGSDVLGSFTQYDGFPNPILTTYEYQGNPQVFDDDPKSVARSAMVAGRFNLNSTSVAAWKALLGGLRINNWPYLDYYPDSDITNTRVNPDPDPLFIGNDQESRGPLFTRFPGTLQETYDVFQTPITAAPSEFYRRGVRYLTPLQIEDLAVNIVNQLKTRVQAGDTPFFTVKDFLNNPDASTGSVLEEAIQASVFTNIAGDRQQWDRSWQVDGNGEDNSLDRIDIDHFSPGFLTQADIMTAIGPMLAPRSDTFKIRARCQTLSPFDSTEVIGDATIEAVVQRTPEPLDLSDDINNSINRKFKIVSVRWLSRDEI